MHSAVHLTCRFLVPVCVSLSLFLTPAQDGLKLSLKFEDTEKGVPVIHMEKTFRMVISNETDADITLPHPLSSSGYQNLKFTFTNRMNGDTYKTYHRPFDADLMLKSIADNADAKKRIRFNSVTLRLRRPKPQS